LLNKDILLRIIGYAFGITVISNIIVFALAAILYFPESEARRLYQIVQKDPGISLLKEW